MGQGYSRSKAESFILYFSNSADANIGLAVWFRPLQGPLFRLLCCPSLQRLSRFPPSASHTARRFLGVAAQFHEARGDLLDALVPLGCEHGKEEVGAADIRAILGRCSWALPPRTGRNQANSVKVKLEGGDP
jgi:hypothetical protein